MSENSIKSTKKAVVDVSGQNKGGEIRSLAKMNNSTSGSYKANTSSGYGGNIDITANQ